MTKKKKKKESKSTRHKSEFESESESTGCELESESIGHESESRSTEHESKSESGLGSLDSTIEFESKSRLAPAMLHTLSSGSAWYREVIGIHPQWSTELVR